jgi:hypothetical protein
VFNRAGALPQTFSPDDDDDDDDEDFGNSYSGGAGRVSGGGGGLFSSNAPPLRRTLSYDSKAIVANMRSQEAGGGGGGSRQDWLSHRSGGKSNKSGGRRLLKKGEKEDGEAATVSSGLLSSWTSNKASAQHQQQYQSLGNESTDIELAGMNQGYNNESPKTKKKKKQHAQKTSVCTRPTHRKTSNGFLQIPFRFDQNRYQMIKNEIKNEFGVLMFTIIRTSSSKNVQTMPFEGIRLKEFEGISTFVRCMARV